MIHQQITVKFKAGALDTVIKLLKWVTFYCTFQEVAIDWTPPAA